VRRNKFAVTRIRSRVGITIRGAFAAREQRTTMQNRMTHIQGWNVSAPQNGEAAYAPLFAKTAGTKTTLRLPD